MKADPFKQERKQQWPEYEHSIERHKIKALYHCTPAENLLSIFRSGGLLSRKWQRETGVRSVRFHGWGKKLHDLEDYICLAFSPPRHLRNKHSDLVAIRIDPRVILLEHTLFSPFNSAKDWMSADELKAYNDLEALELLFGHEYGSQTKRMDAEILVHSGVSWCYFQSVLFEDARTRNQTRWRCFRHDPFRFLKSPRLWSRFQLGTD